MKPKAAKFKCEPIKRSQYPDLVFNATLGRRGYWEEQINLLRGDPDVMLKLVGEDVSSVMQLRQRAKKAGVTLLFAREGDFVFVRAWLPSEDQSRLVLLLREARTVNELKSKGLEMNLEAELQSMASHGHAEYKGGKWKLTPKGTAEMAKTNHAGAIQ